MYVYIYITILIIQFNKKSLISSNFEKRNEILFSFAYATCFGFESSIINHDSFYGFYWKKYLNDLDKNTWNHLYMYLNNMQLWC